MLDPILRSSFGAIEDWNLYSAVNGALKKGLRSSFGAIEDWNRSAGWWRGAVCSIAIVFRGDRGLELFGLLGLLGNGLDCDRLSGRSRIGTLRRRVRSEAANIAIVFRGDRGLEQN